MAKRRILNLKAPKPKVLKPIVPKRKKPERVYTENVTDYLHKAYLYNAKKDKLFIYVGFPRRKILIGKCKTMIETADLDDLIYKYRDAIDEYELQNIAVSELFQKKKEIEDELGGGRDEYVPFDMNNRWLDIVDEIYKIALPERNKCANTVAHLYFIISKK